MAEGTPVETIPIVAGDDGVIRIRGTRVPLETIVVVFQNGSTAEEIAQQYPSLSLADVYQTIGYYLRHSAQVQAYLDARQRESEQVRAGNECRWPSDGIRERLLARCPTGQ